VHGWHAISNIDQLTRLPLIKQPTLCIAGEVDASSPPDVVGQIAKGIPGAQLEIVKGAPHMLFIEQPKEVAYVIDDFLKMHRF
jgi:3-oxoadipate enol-lactonase